LSRSLGVVCALFLILSICEACLSTARGGRVGQANSTERWFASEAFVEAARERKMTASNIAACTRHETGEAPRADCAEPR